MKLLIAEDLNLLREIFLVEEMSNVLSKIPSPGFSIKVQGRGKTVTSWEMEKGGGGGQQRNIKGGEVRRGIHGNSAGNCFVLRDSIPMNFST